MPAPTTRHKLVVLDNAVSPPKLDIDHEIIQYSSTTPAQLADRIKDATLLILSSLPLTREAIALAPKLQLVALNSTGTDTVDKLALKERGITLTHVPAQNTDSVSEHALALYFAVKRRLLPVHETVVGGELWKQASVHRMLGEPPRTCGEEVAVIVGYGALGKRLEKLAKALDMTVLIAERKGATTTRPGRTPFQDALRRATVFFFVAPLDASTRDTIHTAELSLMLPTAVLINVGRGGVINETALAQGLKDRRIAGAATDVFEFEPATKENCPLLEEGLPNLVLSGHVAWYSSRTLKGTIEMQKRTIEGFVNGRPMNVVV